MNKGLKKIIILITFIFSIFTLNPLMAEQAEEPIQSNVETEMEDVSKRLMLSIFGKQALSWYDVETDINYVDEIADSEIYLYTQPFNKNNFSLIRSYIIISLTIGFIMFAIYMFWITKEGILKTQQSGTFLGSNWNTMFTVTKLGLVILLMFPIYTPYSIGHMMIFKITGYSNVISKDISSTIISNQPKTYATTKFPASSGKKTTTEAILKFATCVKASGNDGNVQFNFIEDGNKLKSETFVEDCSLKIVFGMDNSTQEVIEQNKKIKDLLGFNIDFNKLQIKMLENLLKEVLKDSDEYANTLFLPENTSYNEDSKYLLENSEFRNYSLEYATNPILLENWEANCDQLKNYSTLNSNKELTLYEKEQYMFLASRCLSHSVVKKLVYPTQINDFSKYLKTQNYLSNNNIEVCAHDYNYQGTGLRTRALVKETLPENYNDNLNSIETSLQADIQELSILDCLKRECSNLLSDSPNAYMCTNVIYLYNQIEKNKKMEQAGFLTMGAYMYNMFNSGNLNDNAKKLYNGFEAVFENGSTTSYSKKNSVLSIEYNFKTLNATHNIENLKNKLLVTSTIEKHKRTFEERMVQEQGIIGLLDMADGYAPNFLGSHRLSTCIKNSIKIAEGYSCGSFPEELHTFGRNLYEYGVHIKVLTTIYRNFYDVHKWWTEDEKEGKAGAEDGENKKKEDRIKKKGKVAKGKMKKMLMYSLPMVWAYFGGFEDIMEMTAKTMVRTDEFGYLTNEKLEDHLIDMTSLEANALAIFAAWQGDSTLVTIIDFAINTIIFIGLLFAYIFPLIPMYLWLLVVVGWLLLLLETIAVFPLWVPSLLTPTRDNTSEAEKRGLGILMNLFLKAPLLCLGLLTAWIITNSVLGRIMGYLNFEKIFSGEYGYSISGIVDSLMLLIAYVVFLWYIVSITITIIEAFYEFATSWLTGRPNLKTYGNDLSSNFLRKGTQENKIIGLLNPYAKK